MARLRDPERGCPWDLQQTFASIAPYTIEEAYEVADAIARDDREHLRDELGDLLFQVVFHARMAEERGWFDFAAVAQGIHDKLTRRHPHMFAGAAAGAPRTWCGSGRSRRRRSARGGGRAAGRAAGGVLGGRAAGAARAHARGQTRAARGAGRLRLAGCARRCAPRCSRSCTSWMRRVADSGADAAPRAR